MKTCMKCGALKPIEEFYAHPKMSDGRLNKCKVCTRSDSQKNLKRVGSAYDFSKKGFMRVIYKTQKRNQMIRGHGDMTYTKEQLSEWMINNGFDEMYERWEISGFQKDIKPSVDRIDSTIGYSMENIRLITWKENRENQYKDIKNAVGSGAHMCKPVLKIDLDGNVICRYVSYSSAKRDVGYSLERQLKIGTKCKKGFYWKYDQQ